MVDISAVSEKEKVLWVKMFFAVPGSEEIFH